MPNVRIRNEYILGILRWWHDYRYAIRDYIIRIGVLLLTCHGKHTWSQEAHSNLLKRLDETAKKPTSYARKKAHYDAMTDDFVRY